MQLSWCLEEKLARSTSFWRHKRSVRRHINPVIWDITAMWDSVPKGCSEHTGTKEESWVRRRVSSALDQKESRTRVHILNPQHSLAFHMHQLQKLKSKTNECCC